LSFIVGFYHLKHTDNRSQLFPCERIANFEDVKDQELEWRESLPSPAKRASKASVRWKTRKVNDKFDFYFYLMLD